MNRTYLQSLLGEFSIRTKYRTSYTFLLDCSGRKEVADKPKPGRRWVKQMLLHSSLMLRPPKRIELLKYFLSFQTPNLIITSNNTGVA